MRHVIVESLRWLALSVIGFIGVIAFMVFLGDKDPEANLSIGMFILLKLASVVVMFLCGVALFWLSETGNLPKLPTAFYEE